MLLPLVILKKKFQMSELIGIKTFSSGNEKMADLLIKGGANVNISNADGLSPLHQAAACGNSIDILVL